MRSLEPPKAFAGVLAASSDPAGACGSGLICPSSHFLTKSNYTLPLCLINLKLIQQPYISIVEDCVHPLFLTALTDLKFYARCSCV